MVHSLSATCGAMSCTLGTPSAAVVLGVVAIVCVTAVVVTVIVESSKEQKEKKH